MSDPDGPECGELALTVSQLEDELAMLRRSTARARWFRLLPIATAAAYFLVLALTDPSVPALVLTTLCCAWLGLTYARYREMMARQEELEYDLTGPGGIGNS